MTDDRAVLVERLRNRADQCRLDQADLETLLRDAADALALAMPREYPGWMTCPTCGAGATCFNCRDVRK